MAETRVRSATGSGFEVRIKRRGWTTYGPVRFIQKKPLGALGGVLLLLLVLVAALAPWVAPYDPLEPIPAHRLASPSADFLFGTDIFGRDVLSRVIYGTRISLAVGFMSVAIGSVLGIPLGIASGYLGGWVDLVVQRTVDGIMGFPSLILALILAVTMGPSLVTVSIAVAASLTPRMVRLTRGTVLSIREEPYVLAARAVGASALRIMAQHITPNSLAPAFVLATGYLGTAIIVEASLSFLGLGVPPPHPSWGGMLQFAAKGYMEVAPWLVIFPGLTLAIATFAFALFGDALRDVLDPRLRGV